MADERYQWLDAEAAERLLRGEPAAPADDLARLRAERLAAALDAVRAPAADAALPGEAAALAAFREATAARAAAAPGSTRSAAGSAAGNPADLGRVRLARVAAPPRRWGRSARYGLAAAVAAVAVGGVAVAAGTGALPLVGPAPASSVSAGDTARPLLSPEPDGMREDLGIPGPPPPGEDRTPGSSPSTGTDSPAPTTPAPDGGGAGDGGGEGDGEGVDRPKRDVPEPGRSTAGTDGAPDPGRTGGRDRDRAGNGNGNRDGGTDFREKAVEACRAYRSGKLDDGSRRRLTDTLRDGETLRRYCDRVLSGATGAPGDASKGGSKDRPGSGPRNRPEGDAKGPRPGGRAGGSWNRDGGAPPSAQPLAGPASATSGDPLESGATTRLPLAV
ncbi:MULTISPECIES: hypothetical protein [unclassified Streptomyces]|uniref:hypothetical protein n=1 Tax=unclassified Streptomyces TaxID=2593676 RepID=UPI0006B060DD|nr:MULTISPECIES: hypothetical protein [unclassified Streptomyces]